MASSLAFLQDFWVWNQVGLWFLCLLLDSFPPVCLAQLWYDSFCFILYILNFFKEYYLNFKNCIYYNGVVSVDVVCGCVCVCVCKHTCTIAVREQFCGVSSLLVSLCRFWGPNLNHQTWIILNGKSLQTEQSHWPQFFFHL